MWNGMKDNEWKELERLREVHRKAAEKAEADRAAGKGFTSSSSEEPQIGSFAEARYQNILMDRAVGSIVGLAVGDALGSTVEFKSSAQIKAKYGPGGHTEMLGGGFFQWSVGSYTDDGQMMMCLLESLVETNKTSRGRVGLDLNDLGNRFIGWYNSHPPDMGTTVRQGIERLIAGIPAAYAGSDSPDSQSNGAVMRCAPVAVLWHKPDQLPQLLRDSWLSAAPTHRSIVGAGGCAVVNTFIASFINGLSFEEAFVRVLKIADQEWYTHLMTWNEQGRPHKGNTGWVVSTVLTSLHCLLTTQSYEGAVIKAVNGGDDADTVGAVTGELAGAFYGVEAIPPRWLNVLKDSEKMSYLASRLFLQGER
jgi:ADP-ribosyl-[dinitrogen reductase] hydrolase